MATVRGITLTPNEVTVVDLDDAGAVEVTSDGSAPVYYTLDGSDPTPSSTLVIPEGALNDAARAASPGTTIKMLSDGSPSITVAAYSQTEAEATSAVRDVHAALAAEIQTALVEATAAHEMIAEDRPKLEATMVTAAAADEAHAALHARIDAIELTPGPEGPVGPQGPPGNPGTPGSQGAPGDVGPQGPAGADGKSAYQLARDGGYGGTQTQWLASLKGETGQQGPAGPTGQTGSQGPQGIKGDTGLQGPKGDQGLQGPQGVKGDQGLQGIQGPTGPAGQNAVGSLLAVGKRGSLALTGNLAASASGSYTVTIPDMGSADYDVSVWLEATTALLDKLTIAGVVSKTATSVVVRVRNAASTTTLTGTTLRVLAIRLT